MIDLKRNLFKIDVRAQKDEEKGFMRTACYITDKVYLMRKICGMMNMIEY
ncbi:exfoliative toxin [Streptococcus pyogenes]|uniref:Exfoliative toxin n=1 Tax=Streptococcus pyogenes TaxID=1314 RepID=A0A660A7G1_STRPY|nr:exfoliative toxin [Streptococcus pyogenes]AYJ01643.1 exfoliative toxin [Streptococcus pyogenes]AZA32735.1 exfoliative toxin [Streptococcus pyogenes]AZA34529.1 exfoliative toxin [Streptococcus pyogenes]MWP74428.1 exfoliative toxin [Streptococcus pyogenes]MYN36018.1 exfoliative toxin [Streptococcus pyogenes]